MTFFAKDSRVPALHNLVKFYLDELCMAVFTDDRQVSYLSAVIWQPLDGVKQREKSKVYISVQRLADYQIKFDLYFTLLRNEKFQEYLRYKHPELLSNCEDTLGTDELRLGDLIEVPGLSLEARDLIARMDAEERQQQLLSINTIQAKDRPGLPKWANYSPTVFKSLHELEPLAIDLGSLPSKGKTSQYKDQIRVSLQKLPEKHKTLFPLCVPLELDVQVYSQGPVLSKDLDNIMRDIAPIFSEQMMQARSYLHGYRIYVADTNTTQYQADSLRLKLLPVNAITEFGSRVRNTLDVAKEWLRDELDRYG